ncbi:MAG: (Fe-S)-binding protein [Candidatus Heimdallarchaeota archaeon]|nr:(Fe-S)-binding protein [Candidatus Heimdallarchaeota archaeon]
MSALEIMRAIAFLIVIAITLYIVFDSLRQLFTQMKSVNPDPERTSDFGERFKLVLVNVFGQKKMLRNPAGYGHLVIFYGFIFISIVSLEVFIRAFIPSFNLGFLGIGYDFLLFTEDLLSIGVLIALSIGFIRRYVEKPIRFKEKFETDKRLNQDATIILLVVAVHIIFATILEAFEIVLGEHPNPEPAFFANWLSESFSGDNLEAAREVVWWLHVASVWLFLIYIFGTQIKVPQRYASKHFHIIAAAVNVFFSNTKPAGRLAPINFEDEELETYGVSKIEEFKWPQLLNAYSCTGCGRCQELCPAFLNDQPLSPKALILNIREQALAQATINHSGNSEVELETSLIGDAVPLDMLWACTTCGACQDACPVFIEHVDKIIDLRRYQIMMESEMPAGVDRVFNGIETNSNPWNISKSDRDLWADGLELKRMSDYPETETLFWVGCAGSFDERAKKVSTSLVKILKAANIDFAILGKEEKCTGDPARRIGNEYLAQELMTQNVELLNSYKFKEVLTFCPHCFNNLANELPDFGGHYRVVHAVDFVSKLLDDGRIKLDTDKPMNMTYHDSCYLGRHNEIYSAPRKIMNKFQGVNFVEMEMNEDKGLCCGAGGGRMFYEAEGGSDINKMRISQAEETGSDYIGVSCPFCTIMLEDGKKNVGSDLEIIDLVEIVASRLISE